MRASEIPLAKRVWVIEPRFRDILDSASACKASETLWFDSQLNLAELHRFCQEYKGYLHDLAYAENTYLQ